MPSIKTTTPIIGGSYYHIFNRGIDRQPIFIEERNYYYFLQLITRILIDYVDVLAYCLMENHFHMILRVKNEILIQRNTTLKGKRAALYKETDEIKIGKFVTNQFKRLFITYAMAINKQENRVGGLFEAKYKRLEITDQNYLEYSIYYVHQNPIKHGISKDYKSYKFSSFKAICSNKPTQINIKLVFEIFGGKKAFLDFHTGWHEEKSFWSLE